MAPRRSNICITSADQDSLIALRYYELEAYSAVVTALRAEGNLNENKKNVLKQLQEIFGISNDRHKAEIRRVANDENLAAIAKQIQGFPCDDDWLHEGNRIFKVLHHSLPITSYTKLADEIAENLVQENNGCVKSQISKKEVKEISVASAHNPQHSSKKDTLNEIQKLDKDHKESPATCHSDESTDLFDPGESLVYLPSGMVVEVESKSNAIKTTSLDVSTSSKFNSTDSKSHGFKPELASAIESYNIREIPKFDGFKTSEKKPSKNQSSCLSAMSLHKKISDNMPNKNFSCELEQYVDKIELENHSENFRKFEKRSRSLSHSMDGAWATKHTAAADAKRKRKLNRSSVSTNSKKPSTPALDESWSFSPSIEKKAKISTSDHLLPQHLSRAPLPQRSKGSTSKSSPRTTSSANFRTTYHDLLNIASDRMSLDIDCNVGMADVSPPKIFRPSLSLTSPTNEESLPPQSQFNLSSLRMTSHPVEAGLAPVSSIVSQVGTHAGFSSAPPSANLQSNASLSFARKTRDFPFFNSVTLSDTPKLPRPGNVKGDLFSASALASLNGSKPNDVVSTIQGALSFPVESHLFGPMDVAVQPPNSSIKTCEFNPNSIPTFPGPIKPGVQISATCKVLKDSHSSGFGGNRTTSKPVNPPGPAPADQAMASPSTAASVSNAPVSIPRLISTSTPTSSLTSLTSKSILSQASTTNIIKVTPKSLAASKGSPLVTQIAGTRLGNSFNSLKPSIIVVRQAGKKILSPTPTKFLEIDASAKSLPRIKSVSSSTAPVVKTTTIIRAANTKISIQANANNVTSHDLTSSLPPLQKVVTKGKMRQLVLKPTSTSLIRQSSKEPPSVVVPVSSSISSEPDAISGVSFERTSNVSMKQMQNIAQKR